MAALLEEASEVAFGRDVAYPPKTSVEPSPALVRVPSDVAVPLTISGLEPVDGIETIFTGVPVGVYCCKLITFPVFTSELAPSPTIKTTGLPEVNWAATNQGVKMDVIVASSL
jgi:hypothetical protein